MSADLTVPPPMPRPFVPGDEHNPRDFYIAEQIDAINAIWSERVASLQARLEAAERDAKRYRWLVENAVITTGEWTHDGKDPASTKLPLDNAIDAATQEKPAAPSEPPSDERNQCDGCQASMPMRGDIHTDEAGHAVMSCQRGRYALKGNA